MTVRRDEDGFDFTGPFVRGDRTDRHLGLAWGDVPGDGTLRLFRGAKLRLADVDPRLIEEAMRPGHRLVARVRLTDARGNPVCARRPPARHHLVGRAGLASGAGPAEEEQPRREDVQAGGHQRPETDPAVPAGGARPGPDPRPAGQP